MRHCLIWQWLHEVLAPGYSLWDQLGKLCKKHNNRVGLWCLAWRWKKSDDCPLSETLKAPHFDRRRNHVLPLKIANLSLEMGIQSKPGTEELRNSTNMGLFHVLSTSWLSCFAASGMVNYRSLDRQTPESGQRCGISTEKNIIKCFDSARYPLVTLQKTMENHPLFYG